MASGSATRPDPGLPVPAPGSAPALAPSRRYRWYVLFLLFLCYLFNQIDRNILSIVAEDVKRDLGLTDARIGFLYGTAFAVFYAVFGVPFGRLADAWVRRKLIAIGLFFWSLMTAATGTASSFTALALYRVGVGVGEASLSPSAYSMLFDVFPKRLRATALALYTSGGFLGAGASFALGGLIVDGWNRAYPDRAAAPFGLAAWQVAFFAVGLPGLAMAFWVWTLREPPKGGSDVAGGPVPAAAQPEPLWELGSVIPPLTLFALWRAGGGRLGLASNLGIAALLAVVAMAVSGVSGDAAQWIAVAVGLYCAISWAQILRLRDRTTFDSILGSRSFVYAALGFGTQSFVTYGLAFWTAPFLLRAHGASPTRVGALMGIGAMLGGWLGVTTGGLVADRWKARRSTGRIDVGVAAIVLTVPAYYGMVRAASLEVGFVFFLLTVATTSLWLGPGAATANELVPARMRSTASAIYLLLLTFFGIALGPFSVGKVSDALASAGRSPGDALGTAMLLSTATLVVSAVLLLRVRRLIGPAEERLLAAETQAPGPARA